jgi:hypothetical protein
MEISPILLQQAKERYNIKNNLNEDDYKLSMGNFILRIYNMCDPATYGKALTTKINMDNPDELYVVSDGDDIGDLCLTYPRINHYDNEFRITTGISGGPYSMKLDFNKEVKKSFIEGKMSYLGGKSKGYTVRNIRIYQNFDYFLLCLVDCDNDFKSTFIIVDKKTITEGEINLSVMNGTKKSNKKNKNMGRGFAFKKNSRIHKYLLDNNKLKNGCDYKDCINFIKNERLRLKSEFWNWDNHLSKNKWLKNLIKTKEQFGVMFLNTASGKDISNDCMMNKISLLNKNGWKLINDRNTWKCPEGSISDLIGEYYDMSVAYDFVIKEIELRGMNNVLTTLSDNKKIAA